MAELKGFNQSTLSWKHHTRCHVCTHRPKQVDLRIWKPPDAPRVPICMAFTKVIKNQQMSG